MILKTQKLLKGFTWQTQAKSHTRTTFRIDKTTIIATLWQDKSIIENRLLTIDKATMIKLKAMFKTNDYATIRKYFREIKLYHTLELSSKFSLQKNSVEPKCYSTNYNGIVSAFALHFDKAEFTPNTFTALARAKALKSAKSKAGKRSKKTKKLSL